MWIGGIATDDKHIAHVVGVEPLGDSRHLLGAFNHARSEVRNHRVAKVLQLGCHVERGLNVFGRRTGDRNSGRLGQLRKLQVRLGCGNQLKVRMGHAVDDAWGAGLFIDGAGALT
ncbi:unannotated protein [freshwater metagenome]|uniref:Unannotated protein n=1 Tax=freshwater metagenome TaxID=449393 RepID=A0A6J6PHX7_9ZZZZ